jgi:triosephosphate isomerase
MKYVFGNWKMHLGIRESVALARGVARSLRGKERVPEVAIFPAFTALSEVHKAIARSRVALGGQNIGVDRSGAFTGEVSSAMLEDVGCKYALIGHSERRWKFAEDDEIVARRMSECLSSKVIPVLCVGESSEERGSGSQEAFVAHQLKTAFAGSSVSRSLDFIIAYEPVWAIGTGETATVEQAVEMHEHIRSTLRSIVEVDVDKVVILYGGSVKPESAYQLLREREIDGVLVGGASLKIHAFQDILNAAMDVISAQSV